jgi:GNAT superfamily N-acetyltransferase
VEITLCTKADFDQILTDIVDFWDSDRTLYLHHSIFLNEFGNSAFVYKDGECIIGYLFGFLSQTTPTGYVHLLGVRRSYRRHGIGRLLYEYFAKYAKAKGCTELKALASPDNRVSISFHRSIGMELTGEPNNEGIPIVKDYNGPGRDVVVFRKKI